MLVILFLLAIISEGNDGTSNTVSQTRRYYSETFTTKPGDAIFRIGPLPCATSMTFNVTACHGARVSLSKSWEFTDESYSVTLGELRAGFYWADISTGIAEESFKGNPLKCAETQTFWLSWNGTLIRTGHGSVLGYSNFLRVCVSTEFLYFGFNSQTVAEWSVGIYSGGCKSSSW